MKKIIIFLILITSFTCQAQMQNEGVIRYLVTHNWTKKMEAVTFLSKQQKERQAYVWGNRSEWKLYNNLYFTDKETKYEDSEEKAEPDAGDYNDRKETFFIKRDFVKNTLHEAYEVLGKTYVVEDSLLTMEWKIQNDLKEVAGHICMKAYMEDTLRQQKIVAWFAQDIPFNGGPDRFHGLPGMIMEVDINDGALNISANRIDYKKLTTEMDVPKKLKGKKIKQVEYAAMIKKYIDNSQKEERPWFWGIRY
jgi:GLPGLI family protein